MNQVKDFFEYIFNAIKIFVIIQPWEQGLKTRNGKEPKILSAGIHFKIPYFDSVFVQETRLRVINPPIQTLTSKDFKTITLSSSIGYSITSIRSLFATLCHPESTIQNIAMSAVSDFVFSNDMSAITPAAIEEHVLAKLNAQDYGLKFEYFKLANFAIVRTYRLIQDGSYMYEDNTMNCKK